MPDITHPAVAALLGALADAGQDAATDEPRAVLLLAARDWRDGCLELGRDDEACTDAITPGYLVELQGGYSYHADSAGNVRRVPNRPPVPDTELRLEYLRTGGIGGWTSRYEVTSFELTSEDDRTLRDLITRARFFDLHGGELSPPVADGVTTSLTIAVGRRRHTVTRADHLAHDDDEALDALFGWAAERAPAWGPQIVDA